MLFQSSRVNKLHKRKQCFNKKTQCSSCPNLFVSSPHTKSISVLILIWLPQEKKTTEALTARVHKNLTSYVWDEERSVLWDPFLCRLFSAMVQRSVRTWNHIQKEIILFVWIPLSTLKSVGKRPLRKCPIACHWTKLQGVPAFNSLLLLALSPTRCWGVKFMHFRQKTDVSTEGTRHVMVHLAARWLKF